MSLFLKSLQIVAEPGGDISTVRPVDTSVQDVVWATVPNFDNQVQSVPFSEDMRILLSGVGAATAVITIEDISGDTAATLGLSIVAGDDLETAAGTVGAGVFVLKANYQSQDFFSNQIIFGVVATATDTVPPTRPLIVLWGTLSTTSIILEILPSCDPKTPTSTASGMASIGLHRKVGANAYTLLTKIVVNEGSSTQLLENEIGTHGISPSSVQSEADWELTAEGVDGLDSLSEEIFFVAADIVGDCDISCKIPSYAAPTSSKTIAGVMIRESIAGNSKFTTSGRLSNAGSSPDPRFSEVKWRPVTGASIQFDNPQSDLSGDYWFRISRIGNVFRSYLYQEGDQAWTLNKTETIVMNTSVLGGIFLSSGLISTTATVDFENVCLQNLPVIDFIDTGLIEGITYKYKCTGISK